MRKLNVHFTLSHEALVYCRQVNSAIREVTASSIVFSDDSPMIPHVTLAMGELNEELISLHSFLEHVERISASVRAVRFGFGQPYLEDVVNSYVFSDLDGGEYFLDLRRRVNEDMKARWLSDVGGSYGLQPPHLTLAHITSERELVRTMLATLPVGPAFTSATIEVSDVGRKGTCVNSLAKFPAGRVEG